MLDAAPSPLSTVAAICADPAAFKPTDIAGAVAALIRDMASRAAKPTDGLIQPQAARSWARQIALEVCMDMVNPHDDRHALFDALHEAERTVWNGNRLNQLADEIMEAAEGIASTCRHEADVLQGKDE